jgi:hypothetical protein
VISLAASREGVRGVADQGRRPDAPLVGDPMRDVGVAPDLGGSLLAAATTHRERYLAIFELRMESLRRPVLADALAGLAGDSVRFTVGHHAELGLDIPPGAVPGLIMLYGGALFTLVTAPPGELTEEAVRGLAEAVVRGGLGGGSSVAEIR